LHSSHHHFRTPPPIAGSETRAESPLVADPAYPTTHSGSGLFGTFPFNLGEFGVLAAEANGPPPPVVTFAVEFK